MAMATTIHIYTERVSYNATKLEEYHGWALPGTGSATAAWRIMKQTYTDNQLTMKAWADGNKEFNKSWVLKGTYSYS